MKFAADYASCRVPILKNPPLATVSLQVTGTEFWPDWQAAIGNILVSLSLFW